MEYETKYTFTKPHRPYLNSQLSALCLSDSEYASNHVHSLYFDTPDWQLAAEKASSDYLKFKLRIRWYAAPDKDNISAPIFLEIKNKIGSARAKIRQEVSAELSEEELTFLSLQNAATPPRFEKIKQLAITLEPLLPHNIQPAFIVHYHRKRFAEPYSASRVSLDTQIQCISLHHHARHYQLNNDVLEVKSQKTELPAILRPSISPYVAKTAYSKYYEAYQLIENYRQ